LPSEAAQEVANVSLVAQRKVIRISVTSGAKKVISRWAAENDMKEIGVASRIYEWFGKQPEQIQRGILGLYGRLAPDIARMVLERMADGKKARLGEGTAEARPPPEAARGPKAGGAGGDQKTQAG